MLVSLRDCENVKIVYQITMLEHTLHGAGPIGPAFILFFKSYLLNEKKPYFVRL